MGQPISPPFLYNRQLARLEAKTGYSLGSELRSLSSAMKSRCTRGPRTDKLNLRTVSADKFTEQVTSVISRFAITQHFLTNYRVEVNNNEAVCVSYMQARHFKPGRPTWGMDGYYTHHLVGTDDGWKIPKYTLTVTWDKEPVSRFQVVQRVSEGRLHHD